MKKIITLFCILCFVCFGTISEVYSETTSTPTKTQWTSKTGLEKVTKIGNQLLTKNSLPTKVTFTVMETDDINAFASNENQICVYTGLLNYVNNDDELAGVIAHEIGHIVNNHIKKQSIVSSITSSIISNADLTEGVKTGANIANNLSMLKMSRTQENEADITGADLMIKAGYNPLAMVSFFYKISGNYVDIMQTHPSGDKRTMYIYDYLTYTYPDKVKQTYATDSYNQFMQYATPIVKERNANKAKLSAFNKKQSKLQEKRLKKLANYKKQNPWASSYETLKSIYNTANSITSSTY